MKNNRLIIIGASGHGKVVADIAKLNGYTNIAFLDDDSTKKECAVISDTVIGAGAVVIDNIKLAGTYIGVPAKRMDRG